MRSNEERRQLLRRIYEFPDGDEATFQCIGYIESLENAIITLEDIVVNLTPADDEGAA